MFLPTDLPLLNWSIRKHIAGSLNKESVNKSIFKKVFLILYLFITSFTSRLQKYLGHNIHVIDIIFIVNVRLISYFVSEFIVAFDHAIVSKIAQVLRLYQVPLEIGCKLNVLL